MGSEAFRKELLGRVEWRLGDHRAGELRRETTLTVGWIAARLGLGTRQSARTRLLRGWKRSAPTRLIGS